MSAFAEGLACNSEADCFGFEVCEEGHCEMPKADWRKGLELEVRLGAGLPVMIADQDLQLLEDYEDHESTGFDGIKPGGGGGVYVAYRPVTNFSVGLNLGYFVFGDEKSNYASMLMNAMAEFRGYMSYGMEGSGFGDIHFSAGLGYLSARLQNFGESIPEAPDSRTLLAPINFKLGIGSTFYFTQNSPRGDIGVGLGFDFLIFFTKNCRESAGPEAVEMCGELEKEMNSPFNTVQLTAHLKWVLPIGGDEED